MAWAQDASRTFHVVPASAEAAGTAQAALAGRAFDEAAREPLHPRAGARGLDWAGRPISEAHGGQNAMLHRASGSRGAGAGSLASEDRFHDWSRPVAVLGGAAEPLAFVPAGKPSDSFGLASNATAGNARPAPEFGMGLSPVAARGALVMGPAASRELAGRAAGAPLALGAGVGAASVLSSYGAAHVADSEAAMMADWMATGGAARSDVAFEAASAAMRSASSSRAAASAAHSFPTSTGGGGGRASSFGSSGGAAGAAASVGGVVLRAWCPGARRDSRAWHISVLVPMQEMAVLREDGPARSPADAEPLPSSGTCTVTVRCLPEDHSVADVIKAAVVKARQANPITSSMRDRFELVLRDGRQGEEAIAIGSHGASSVVALPLAALHQAARSSDPALLARSALAQSSEPHVSQSSSSAATAAAAAAETKRAELAAARAAGHIANLATAASHRGVLQVRRSLAANQLVREPEPDAVRVMTYNLLAPPKFRAARSSDKEFLGGPEVWLPRAQLQARVIAAASADIVCLQELWRDPTLQHSGLRPAMQGTYRAVVEASRPEAVDQVVMFVKREDVAVRQGRPVLSLAEACPDGTGPTMRLVDEDRRAACAVAVFQATSSTGASYRICCAVMHLLFVPVRGSMKQLNFTRAARLKQAKFFKEQVLAFAHKHGLRASGGDVVVMTGDINMEGGIGDKATMAESPDAGIWAEFSSPVHSEGGCAHSGAFVSAFGVAQRRRRHAREARDRTSTAAVATAPRTPAGRGTFVSHVTREGQQRGADYIMLAAPLEGHVADLGGTASLPKHPADRVGHCAVLPECLRADAKMPYPQIGGLARIPLAIVRDAAALPEGVWADLSDHRPVVADIHPPV